VAEKPKVGHIVWYVVGSDTERQQAKIIAVEGSTQARIRLLTGPQVGTVLDVPWGVIHPLEAHEQRR